MCSVRSALYVPILLSVSAAVFRLFRLGFCVCHNIFSPVRCCVLWAWTSTLFAQQATRLCGLRPRALFPPLRCRSTGHWPAPLWVDTERLGMGVAPCCLAAPSWVLGALWMRIRPPLVSAAPRVGTAAGTREAWGRATLHEGGCCEAAPPWRGSPP